MNAVRVENARREVRRLAKIAHGEHAAVARELLDLVDARAQLLDRDVDHVLARDAPLVCARHGVHGGRHRVTHVEHKRLLRSACRCEALDRRHHPAPLVEPEEANRVDHVARRPEGGGVGEVQVREVVDGEAARERRGDDVEALVHTVETTHSLGSEELAAALVVHDLEGDRVATRVVTRMRRPRDRRHRIIQLLRDTIPLTQARLPGHAIKHPHDRRPKRPTVRVRQRVTKEHVVGRNARHAVRRPAEREPLLARGGAEGGGRNVARGVHVGVRGLHVGVHDDGLPSVDLEARGLREGALGDDADRLDDEVGDDALARGELDRDLLVCGVVVEGDDLVRGHDADALDGHLLLHGGHDLVVEEGHHAVLEFDDRDLEPAVLQGLGHLQPDEAGADDDTAPARRRFDELDRVVHVLKTAHGEKPASGSGILQARNRRDEGGRTRSDEELVVGHSHGGGAGGHADGLVLAVDRLDIVPDLHVHVQRVLEVLGRRHDQPRAVPDLACHVVRQAAGGD
mmetsp:Transcript_53051/g.129581  ORF Transcript_53051/g.129581 Transcript_53051/m.129581 type:complete len:514 (+) Transcript_53051:919-2460(+)